MSTKLISTLESVSPLSEGLILRLNSILKHRSVKKREFLLKPGQFNDEIYFIEKGLVRLYYIEDGIENCSGLLAEGGIMVSVRSFFKREKSNEYIQAIEDTEVFYITFDEQEELYSDFPEYNLIARKLITEYYVMSEDRNYMLRRHSAQDKLRLFEKKLSHLNGRVPRKDIASYLGINLETLSRIGY